MPLSHLDNRVSARLPSWSGNRDDHTPVLVTDSLPDRLEAEEVGVAGVELSSMVSKQSFLHTVIAREDLLPSWSRR